MPDCCFASSIVCAIFSAMTQQYFPSGKWLGLHPNGLSHSTEAASIPSNAQFAANRANNAVHPNNAEVVLEVEAEELTVVEDLEGLLRNELRIFGATICHMSRRIDALEEDRATRR